MSHLDSLREQFEADPDHDRAFEGLEEEAFLRGAWQELILLYNHRLGAPGLESNAPGRASLLHRLGQIWEERLQDVAEGTACYERAVRADPSHRPSLQRLHTLHSAGGRWDVVLQIAEIEIELPMPGPERAALLAETGDIWLQHLDQPQQALVYFERALGEEPKQSAALAGAAVAYEAVGRSPEAAAAWERVAALASGAERAEALSHQARLTAGALGEPGEAVELYRNALRANPRHPGSLEAVADHARQNGEWVLLADLEERRCELASGDSERLAIALEAGRVQLHRLDNVKAAHWWFAKAAELGPDNPSVFQALADVERERGDDAALLRCLDRVLALCDGNPPISALLESAALLAEIGDDESALERLTRALEQNPDDVLVVEAMSDALARMGRDEELVDVLERRAALATDDSATRANILAELGALHSECLANPEASRHAYERSLEADPSVPGVISALEQHYRKSESWQELRRLLETASRQSPLEDRAGWLSELATLLADRFDDLQGAMRSCEAALEIEPAAVAAHRDLQRFAEQSGDEEALIRAMEREVAVTSDRRRLSTVIPHLCKRLEGCDRREDALRWFEHWADVAGDDLVSLGECARLHESLDHDAELVACLERLDSMLESIPRATNRRRLGTHHAAHGRRDEAVNAYQLALESDPENVEALEELMPLLEATGALRDLADKRRWLANLLPPHRRGHCLNELAVLLEERLGDTDGAIEALTRISDEVGTDWEVEERLENLLERAGRHAELVARLRTRSHSLTLGSADSIALHLRRARILLDDMGRFEDAAAAYREVRGHDPTCRDALEGLERALRAAGNAEALEGFLAERVAKSDDPEVRDSCALERAVLLEEVLDRVEEARETYGQLAADADDPIVSLQASRRLDAMLERVGAWGALCEHLEARLESRDEGDSAAARTRLGRLCRDRLGDRTRAIEHLEAAAAMAPERAEGWRELAELYDQEGRSDDLLRALEAELQTQPDVDRELALRTRAAGVQRDTHPERAGEHYLRILEIDPSQITASEFAIESCEREGRYDTLVGLLEARLAVLDGAPRDDGGAWESQRVDLRLRIAGLRDQHLDDLDGAIAILEPGLGEIGAQAIVAEPLADFYQRAGYREDLLDLSRSAAARAIPGPERAGWFVRVGDALRAQGNDREAAQAFRQALSDQPDDPEAKGVLRDLYRRLEQHEPLARMLENQIGQLGGREEILARLELAGLLANSLNDAADALTHLQRVLQIEPGHGEALTRALALAESAGLDDVLLQLVETALEQSQPPVGRVSLLVRRGELLSSTDQRLVEAAASLKEALALDPARRSARVALRHVLERLEDWDGVIQCLHQETHGANSQARIDLYESAAEITREHFSPEAALPWLERLRRECPEDAGVAARIAEIHRGAGRPDALLRALDDQLASTPDPDGRRDLYIERAGILEDELLSPARAAAELEAANRIAPADRDILRRLEVLYRLIQRPRERAGVLEKLAPDANSAERSVLQCELATLYTKQLGEPQRAVAHLLATVSEAPRGSTARSEHLRSLGDSLRLAGPAETWARCCEEELRSLDRAAPVFEERRRALQRDLADVYENQLGRLEAAMHHLRALVDGGAEDDCEAALVRLLRQSGSGSELGERLAVMLERRGGGGEEWLELARLHDEQLRSPTAAAGAYRAALEADPSCLAAARGLRGVSERIGDWGEVARSLEIELANDAPQRERAALLRKLGDVCWRHLRSTTRASRSYAAALEANPEDLGSLHALQELMESMEDWSGALELYESEVETLGERESERRQAVLLRAGEIARNHGDDIERARRAYTRAAELGPLPCARRAELAELHMRCGDEVAFCAEFAAWCDDPAAEATSDDHVRLAGTLESLEQNCEALARIERALALDDENSRAWDAAARLRHATGDDLRAATALSRAAEGVPDAEAAARLLAAARLCPESDLERATGFLRDAALRDSGDWEIQAELARAAEQLGEGSEALQAAGRALDLAPSETVGDLSRRTIALVGGRSARSIGALEEAVRFYSGVLAEDPNDPEGLAGHGECLAELGDLAGARTALERRLEQDATSAERALHLTLVGRCLASEGELDAARDRFELALEEEPRCDDAHEGLVALLEQRDDIDPGVAALERWADCATRPTLRSERLLRAAEWEHRDAEREADCERHLREVLESDPNVPRAWQLLTSLLWKAERSSEALDVASRALEGVVTGIERGSIALVRARALEQQGDPRAAEQAYADAAVADRRCVEAVLSRARILRGLGEWRASADALQAFADRHPGDDDRGLAEVLQQRGRLLAGPLEDLAPAIDVYRRALELDPDHSDSRTALAELLAHSPEHWREAIEHQRVKLAEDPTCTAALLSLVQVVRKHADERAAAGGLVILRSLGAASPGDCQPEDEAEIMRYGMNPTLDDRRGEILRRVAVAASGALAEALGASEPAPVSDPSNPHARFLAAALSAEGRLTSHALTPLDDTEVAEILTQVVTLTLAPDSVRGDGKRINALASALGRRQRRRLRKLLGDFPLEDLETFDFGRWRGEVRGLAAAAAVDETGGDLRSALIALIDSDSDGPAGQWPENANLTPRVAASPRARMLLQRAICGWAQGI